jgi:tetratricopeptide (TPR) repeat protein
VKVAMDAGDDDEADRLRGLVDAYEASGAFMDQIGSGPQRLFYLMIAYAEAHEAVGNWLRVQDIYGALMKQTIVNNLCKYEHERRMLFTGVAKCAYKLGLYDHAVASGMAALSIDRRKPGVHKLIALPQLALGRVEAALTTMRRGIVYEAPWDDKNQETNIAFLEECLRDQTTTKGGL